MIDTTHPAGDAAQTVREAESWLEGARRTRDQSIRQCYAEGMTLQKLADITGMTRQRIQQIITEREG